MQIKYLYNFLLKGYCTVKRFVVIYVHKAVRFAFPVRLTDYREIRNPYKH